MKDDLTLDTERLDGITKKDAAARNLQPLMEAYRQITGSLGEDDHTVLTDLLADLMHWAATREVDFYPALAQAERHFEAEIDPDDAG